MSKAFSDTIVNFFSVVMAGVIVDAIIAYPVMLLWNNSLVGAVNFVKPIGYFDAWGILILCNLLGTKTSTTNTTSK